MSSEHKPNGNKSNGDPPPVQVQDDQYVYLGAIQIISFTANPPRIKPFETTTLSVEVTLPTKLQHIPVTLAIGGKPIQGLSGSASFTLTSTTEFALLARTPVVERVIGPLVVVTMDESECKPGSIPTYLLKNTLQETLNAQFQGSSQYSLRSGGVIVKPGDDLISIAIPLHLNVPDWFDADMDVSFDLEIQMGLESKVLVTAPNVDVHVTWTWVNDLAKHTELAEKLAQAFIAQIVNGQLVPLVAQGLTDQIQKIADPAKEPPKPAPYALTSLSYSPDAITFTVCPASPSMIINPVGKRG